MIQRDMLYKPSFNYIKKERFTGSIDGMRYMLEKRMIPKEEPQKTEEEQTPIEGQAAEEPKEPELIPVIAACHWPEPLCYEKTEEQYKITHTFEFSKEGLESAWDWLDEEQKLYL